MAKQKEQYIIGKKGNVSYYFWKGVPCIRSIPAKVHQCAEVQANTKVNGASTTMAKSFRNMLERVLPYPRSFDMQTRFRGALRNWLKYSRRSIQPPEAIPYLEQFSFNEASTLKQVLKVPLLLTQPQPDELLLQIPSFIPYESIAAPARTTTVQMTIIAACCDITTALPMGKSETILTIPYAKSAQPAQDISLSLQMPFNSLTLVMVSIRFFISGPGNMQVTDERWQPTQVVGGVARVGD